MIITLPLGCLKAGDIDFQPALPEWKTDAIAKLGYGNLNKVDHPSWGGHALPPQQGRDVPALDHAAAAGFAQPPSPIPL